jgi:hypothetical protein
MLGIDVAKSIVEKYQSKRAGPPSPTWGTFLDQHVRDLVSMDRDAPDGRPIRAAEPCNIVEFPAVHGLHHFYLPKAA